MAILTTDRFRMNNKNIERELSQFLRLSDAMFGFIDTSVLWGALRTGIFDYIDAHPRVGAARIAAVLRLVPVRVEKLFRVLIARGFVVPRGGGFRNAEFVRRFLLSRSVSDNKNIPLYFAHWARKMAQYGELMPEVLRGRVSSEHVWPPKDPAHSALFEKVMQGISWIMPPLMARGYDFSRHRKVLDAGGGNGAITLELARAFPSVSFAVLNVPSGAAAARAHIAAAGMSGRVEVLGGDYRKRIPEYGDCLLWTRNMHDYSDAVRKKLAVNSYGALPPGGTLLIIEGVRNPRTLRGYAGYMYSAIGMENSWFYPHTLVEYRELLRAAGFTAVRETPLPGGIFSVISAVKPR